MRGRNLVCAALTAIVLFCLAGTALAGWVEDKEYGFRIKVPVEWSKKRFRQGEDTIHVFVNPAEDVVVRVRAFKAAKDMNEEGLRALFEKNVLPGMLLKNLKPYELNNIKGLGAAYRGPFKGYDVVAIVFYALVEGKAFVVWTAMEASVFDTKRLESDAVTDSFQLFDTAKPRHSAAPRLTPATAAQQASAAKTALATKPATSTRSARVTTPRSAVATRASVSKSFR